MLIGIVVSAITAVFVYFLVTNGYKRWRHLQKLKKFPGPPSLPVLGNALDLSVPRGEVLKVLDRWVGEYGRRFKIFLGFQSYVMLTNGKDVETILSSQAQIEKSGEYELLYPWLGVSLLTGGGKKWFHRRKQLTPAFHFKILEDFIRVFNEQCATLTSILEGKKDQTFDIFPIITHCALDIICETAMGRKINAQQECDSDYVKAIYRMTELLQYRVLRPWLNPNVIWNLTEAGKEESRCISILHEFTESVIRERKKDREEMKKLGSKTTEKEDDVGSKKRLAFLDLLLEAQETDSELTDVNLREETDTFMFEGHDTTSAAASWAIFLLACNPDIQAKVHEELDRIFGNDKDRDVTLADVAEMKYLECCIKESLRIYPSVPFIGRKMTHDFFLDDGSIVPAGCIIWVLFFFLHRDPKVFPDPEKFDPDRFLPENVKGRHPFAYAPFSAGPRNCIGQKFALMEEKVIISKVFRGYKVINVDKREDVVVLSEVITRPENGLRVKLEKR